MNVSIFKLKSFYRLFQVAFISISFLVMVACSNTSEGETSSTGSIKYSTKKEFKNKYVEHIHPENICFGARSHAHVGGEKEHKHSMNCIQSKNGTSNAHIHPADKEGNSFRHVHPNGSNEHSHH